MKLEIGKFYKTRDGQRAYIAAIGSPFKNPWENCEALGWIEDDDVLDNCQRWSKNGECNSPRLDENWGDSDLIEEIQHDIHLKEKVVQLEKSLEHAKMMLKAKDNKYEKLRMRIFPPKSPKITK